MKKIILCILLVMGAIAFNACTPESLSSTEVSPDTEVDKPPPPPEDPPFGG